MAKKHRGGRRGRTFPVLMSLPVLVPAWKAYSEVGLTKELPANYLWQQTGYNIHDGHISFDKTGTVIGLVILGAIGHKVANRLGINRQVKKLSAGMLSL